MSGCFYLNGLSSILCRIAELLNYVLPVLIVLGVVYLVWGVVRYMIGDSEEAKKKGKDGIIFGIIGLVVIVSLWGLVYIVVNTFNLRRDNFAPTPFELDRMLPI
ncbi:TPA: hypothetical protein DEQ22_02940 [Candidatus Nomurabacteria bacterium]|uniref:Uncharacterized protein n=2 Tax=Candidatus Nomuraibacteriota TaxID=1752729 RepID=A0A1F6YQB0_9BACT|nr:MAG: hypothetical protein UV13_C0010G0007 [Parcubacteria group bacterium GW2011_GWC1_42_21]KKS57874.1 MAG: hypothetical protein UV23_C0021G0007 [Candidatus Nomurabacteria bacterium GW2011_GWF1_42_40]KKS99967.1 MAG: hypothetical protein UV77_C0009G0007 [Candidatus Nomurabacteria bacterium GW2011_GWA1_43_17]KKT06809.1 MAG: hypothetical protein UV85_C0015G0007 [Candidatus Nomurabacteria bacterium GW2011_GWB1_43_19]KKT10820.1 MAG: hypothetical protein UV91_C0010G0007 [Candidatus Nomurabacteria b